MITRAKVFHAIAVLGSKQVASQVLRLARSVTIARILSPADFGIAATFWITTSLLEVLSEIGIQQRLIQAKDGDDDRVGAVAQALFLVRGLMHAAAIFAFACPISRLFSAPETAWAFQLLALVPLIGGFTHRDVDRFKRRLRFGPQVITGLAGDLLATVSAIPIAMAVRDYSAFLYVSLLNTAVAVILSHVVAERPFRVAWDSRIVRQFTGFGWPLMINSLLMYSMMQGDRIVLARAYTKEELGVYSVAIGLVLAASGMLQGIVGPLQLPLLASAQGDRPRFERQMRLQAVFVSAVAMLLGMLFITIGPSLVTIIYGPKYELASVVIGWVGLTKAIHTMRSVPSTAAMALGDTRNSMFANLVRQTGIILAAFVAWRGWGLQWIAISQFAGEILAYLAAVPILWARHGVPQAICWRPAALAGVGLSLALLATCLAPQMRHWFVASSVFAVLSGALLLGYGFAFPAFVSELNFLRTAASRRLQRTAA